MDYWHKLSKRFAIKMALPHLLFGVVAAAFSLSAQSGLPASQQPANIITIAAVMVNLQELQSDRQMQTICIADNQQQMVIDTPLSAIQYQASIPVIRLTPNNGIRAGPFSLFA